MSPALLNEAAPRVKSAFPETLLEEILNLSVFIYSTNIIILSILQRFKRLLALNFLSRNSPDCNFGIHCFEDIYFGEKYFSIKKEFRSTDTDFTCFFRWLEHRQIALCSLQEQTAVIQTKLFPNWKLFRAKFLPAYLAFEQPAVT
jgi:hypothetical protein